MSSELFWKMNTESNAPDQVTGEKHSPIITVIGEPTSGEKVKVKVDVGGGIHPNENAHFIQWIELRCNGLFLARAEFAPVVMDPVAKFVVNVPGGDTLELSAVSRCNLHGLWESKKSVEVV